MPKDDLLYDLANAMATDNEHLAAAALRKLRQVGYASLQEIDRASDWVLLAIPGIGVGYLAEVRRLTRSSWKPPSEQALRAANDFMTKAQLALRLWPVEALISAVQGLTPAVPSDHPADNRLALRLLSQAATRASCHCPVEELVEALRQAGNNRQPDGCQQESHSGPDAPAKRKRPKRYETNHFAYPISEREQIVEHFLAARAKGQIVNKNQWAQMNYQISSKTLLKYEREYEQARANGS